MPRPPATSEYPERLPAHRCWWNAREMVGLHPELALVEGYVVWNDTGRRMAHAWNLAPDGSVVDSTAWAWSWAGSYRYQPDPQAWRREMWPNRGGKRRRRRTGRRH
jgi:hypothetical protein